MIDFEMMARSASAATSSKSQTAAPASEQVFLFSGHMIDAPGRSRPRFPATKAPMAARKIAEALDYFHGCPKDLALAQGASGGDILFLEACEKIGMRIQMLLPLPEHEFIERSILPSAGGRDWQKRYLALRAKSQDPKEPMRTELDLPTAERPAAGTDPFVACNRKLLQTALAFGPERLRFICLWDGGADGPGGTAHMVEEVRRSGGRVFWLDTREL